jgi:hypothetical protein
MNLVDAEAFEEGGRMYVRIGEGRIELPPGTAGEVRRLGTCLFVLGLRPERVRISGDPGPSALRGIVASAEYLGRERLVSVNTALGVLTVLTGEEGPKAGDVVGLDLPLETASVFRSERSSP